MAIKLTKTAVDAAVYTGDAAKNQRCVIWDSQLPGFGVRIFPGGRKSFVLSYRHHKRKRLMTIGNYGVVTVETARGKAYKALGKLSESRDPLHEKQQDAEGDTLKKFAPVYMRRHADAKKKSAKDDEQLLDNIIVPAMGAHKLKAIKRDDVSHLHQKIGETINEKTGKGKIYQANRVLALLSKMFSLAEQWGHVPEGHPNPCRGIQKFKEEKRDRWITQEELPRVAEAIDKEANPVARNALWLYLLTGLRRTELLSLQWTDVDLNRAEIRLADTKASRKHYLHLSAPAVELMRSMVKIEGNPYVLPGKLAGKHLVNIDKPWRRVRKAADVEDARLHDLRRTMGSWLAQNGNSLHLIGRVLNHSNASTTQVYARFGQDSVNQAVDTYGEQIMGAAGKKESAKVVKING